MPDPQVVDITKLTAMVAERLANDAATRSAFMTGIDIDKLMDTESGKAWMARAINTRIAEVETKIASNEELRTKAEKEVAALGEKLRRKEQYEQGGYGFHRGIDGKVKPNINPEAAEKLATFIRTLHARNFEGLRAMSSSVGSEGGYFVPVEVASEVLRLIPETGLYPQIARNWPMTSETLDIGEITSSMSAYWPGQNQPLTPSYPVAGKAVLVAKLLGAFTALPLSLLQDSTVPLGQLVADLMRECIGKEVDRVFIAGKSALNGGTDTFDGLLWAASINVLPMNDGETSMSKFNPDYLLDLQTAVPEGGRDNCSYIISPTVFNYARKAKDKDGDPIWTRPADGEPGTIYGKPYFVTERMPSYSKVAAPNTRFVLYGNWGKFAAFGNRMELSVATSDTAGTAWQNCQMAYRAITRVAGTAFGPALAVLATANE